MPYVPYYYLSLSVTSSSHLLYYAAFEVALEIEKTLILICEEFEYWKEHTCVVACIQFITECNTCRQLVDQLIHVVDRILTQAKKCLIFRRIFLSFIVLQ